MLYCHILPPGSLQVKGALVSFIEECLFWLDIKWSPWEIHYKDLFKWNLWRPSPGFCSRGAQTFPLKKLELLQYILNPTVYVFVDIKDAPKILQQCAETWIKYLWYLNSLCAKFFRGNINMYSHFMSFLHTDKPKIIEILPRIRPGHTYFT